MAVARSAVSFGDIGTYGGSFGIPKGTWALSFEVKMHAFVNKAGTPVGEPGLGVMVTAYNLNDPTADPVEEFLGMGRKAHLSFQPDPDGAGKKLVAVPNGPGGQLNDQTNWGLFLKSLYDAGLPKGIFIDDISVIDGIHVVTDREPEPESRKELRKTQSTGEVETPQANRGPKTIPTVVEILDDGKPWEGTGGIPEAEEAKPKAKAPAKPAAAKKPAAKPAPEPEAEEEGEASEELLDLVMNELTPILAKSNGKPAKKILVKSAVFKAINTQDPDTAQAVQESILSNDAALAALLGKMGYELKGGDIIPS